MTKFFITGGSGFLGRHLVNKLSDFAENSIDSPDSKSCNLTQERSLNEYNSESYNYIIHLAAWTQAGDFCLRHPGEQWIYNQQINTNILNWWWKNQPQAKLVFMGTSCSYPEGVINIETNYLQGSPTQSLYTYAMTKRMLLVGAQALSKQYGLEFCSFIPSTLYGHGYHNDGRQMHFIFDLVRKIVDASKGGDPPKLWGDGNQVREIVHVDDFLNIMIKLINDLKNDIVNIAGIQGHTIREFANIICNLCQYDPSLVEYDTSKYVGAKQKTLDKQKLIRLIGEYKQIEIEKGLNEIIDWYKNLKQQRS
jgi:GDP-L-fucose synthase